jgi:hypothetical protein
MPGAEMFSIITDNRTYSYPDDSSIPGSQDPRIVQVNGTRKNMHELEKYRPELRLPVGHPFSPDWSWYVPFIVSDTFDPDTSYVTARFDNNSIVTWKFR